MNHARFPFLVLFLCVAAGPWAETQVPNALQNEYDGSSILLNRDSPTEIGSYQIEGVVNLFWIVDSFGSNGPGFRGSYTPLQGVTIVVRDPAHKQVNQMPVVSKEDGTFSFAVPSRGPFLLTFLYPKPVRVLASGGSIASDFIVPEVTYLGSGRKGQTKLKDSITVSLSLASNLKQYVSVSIIQQMVNEFLFANGIDFRDLDEPLQLAINRSIR